MPSLAATLLTVTVRVYDVYGLPTAERQAALVVAGDTLAQAGVQVNWVQCQRPLPDACLTLMQPGEMVLRIHPEANRSRSVLGTAFVQPGGPNVMATVHGPAVYERSLKYGVRLSTLVGRVAAHEIGHLLIGVNSHSPHGLMRATWDVRRVDLADWLFSTKDAATMRRRLIEADETRSANARSTN